jgi:exonuclease SbcC
LLPLKEESTNASRRDGIATRIDDIAKALVAAINQRNRLLEQGAVATRDDVKAPRSHRDSGWAFVRGMYIDRTNPAVGSFGGGAPLPLAYEEAVVGADRLIDELASDTERAAQLQASKDAIILLQRDSDDLKRQLADIERAEAKRCAAWNTTLVEATLPAQSPAALREWQALLQVARTALESLQTRLDELEQVQGIEKGLAARLSAAIFGTDLATPAQEEVLSTLSANAAELDDTIRQRETAINKAAGQQSERERQRQQRETRELQLTAALEAAKREAQSTWGGLLLPDDSDVAVARARIAEFEDLSEAKDRLTAATTKQERAEEALAVLAASARAIWESLGDPEPKDLRLCSERLSARLEAAETAQTARALAQQAADSARDSQRTHEATAARHEAVIATLCLAAAVASVNQLPEAENNSRRKREAQAELDRSRSQLALASRRTVDELRALLADQDAARMDTEEASYSQEQVQVDANLRIAREAEERARRDLEANRRF